VLAVDRGDCTRRSRAPHVVREHFVAESRKQHRLVDDERHLGDDDASDVGYDLESDIGVVLQQLLLNELQAFSEQRLSLLNDLFASPRYGGATLGAAYSLLTREQIS
jgi:hypothetical protein